jgi:hypothetical protein
VTTCARRPITATAAKEDGKTSYHMQAPNISQNTTTGNFP